MEIDNEINIYETDVSLEEKELYHKTFDEKFEDTKDYSELVERLKNEN